MNRTSTAFTGGGLTSRPTRASHPAAGQTAGRQTAGPVRFGTSTVDVDAGRTPDRSGRPGRGRKGPKPAKPQFRKLVLVDPESLARALETRSQIAPAQPLDEAVRKIAEDVGAEGAGVDRVIGWTTELKAGVIGDLKRIDRMKLAREMYRYWRPGAPVTTAF